MGLLDISNGNSNQVFSSSVFAPTQFFRVEFFQFNEFNAISSLSCSLGIVHSILRPYTDLIGSDSETSLVTHMK